MISKLNYKLSLDSKLFGVLREMPEWWKNILAIEGVYAEVRKNNVVDIYFEGGRIAEIVYDPNHELKIKATCHLKYLNKCADINEKAHYVDCTEKFTKTPKDLIENIKSVYSEKGNKTSEEISEKHIQGELICRRNPVYIDSEFAHRFEDGSKNTIRFDLVKIIDNTLCFIELKRIADNRMLNKNDDKPEILEQMEKYYLFISENKESLLEYYKLLLKVKKSIGLPVPNCDLDNFNINEKPHLLIYNTYTMLHPKRDDRISRMNEILSLAKNFSYSIEKWSDSYAKKQQKLQASFMKELTNNYYILPYGNSDKNIYNWEDGDALKSLKEYFSSNNIKWWNCFFDGEKGKKPDGKNITRHMLSSQIACINHLFFIKQDKDAVLSIINGIKGMPVKFQEVLNIPCDKGIDNYIAFEMVASQDYLNEGKLLRGEYCTSIDAFIYAVDEYNEKWLIPIEWKYTESYSRDDKSTESYPLGSNNNQKGNTRLKRYCNLISCSKQLKELSNYINSIYFQEPFYQLMRQTLWAETICNSKSETMIPADHFVHIHICPYNNHELLNKHYAEVTEHTTMESAWRSMLYDQSLYHLVNPRDLMAPIKGSYPKLYKYLQERYWQ